MVFYERAPGCETQTPLQVAISPIDARFLGLLNQGKVIMCAISTAAMDNIEATRDVRPDQRIDQFMRLRDVIEERASRKFFEEQVQADRPVVLRSNDFAL